MLLESEQRRRAGAFYDIFKAGGPQGLEVETPFGYVTVLEVPSAGIVVTRDDGRHWFTYLASETGWRLNLTEDDVREVQEG